MNATAAPTPPPAPLSVTPAPARPLEPARVSFVPVGPGRHRLDGAWWPRSRDLRAQLPAFVAALDLRFGRIGHLTVNHRAWPEVPHRVAVAGRSVRVGWFGAEQDPDVICVLAARGGRWDLLVVPPECPPERARLLMAAAGAARNQVAAAVLMAG